MGEVRPRVVDGTERRRFFRILGATGVGAFLAGTFLGSRLVQGQESTEFVFSEARKTLRLPGIGSDPASPLDGEIWRRSDTGELRHRAAAGTTRALIQEVLDEGSPIGIASGLDFAGDGVSVALVGKNAVVTIPGGGGGPHNILSATHSDAITAAATRGDLMIGNAGGVWSDLAVGGSGQVLRSNGTDPAWAQLAHADLGSVSADQHHAQDHVSRHHSGGLDALVLSSIAGELTDGQHGSRGSALHADSHARSHALDSASDHSGSITDAQHGTRATANAHAHGDLSGVTSNQHHAQAHALTGADHTHSGGTAGRFLRETGASTFAFEAITVPIAVGTVLDPAGARTFPAMDVQIGMTVTRVAGYRTGGTGATVNAVRRRSGVNADLLSSDLSVSSADSWVNGGAPQNTALQANDAILLSIRSVTGSPTEVGIAVTGTRP